MTKKFNVHGTAFVPVEVCIPVDAATDVDAAAIARTKRIRDFIVANSYDDSAAFDLEVSSVEEVK